MYLFQSFFKVLAIASTPVTSGLLWSVTDAALAAHGVEAGGGSE